MNIKTTEVFQPIGTIPAVWTAVDDDTYDGPPALIGWGKTEAEAIADLMEQLEA